jgi:hypothetical protein
MATQSSAWDRRSWRGALPAVPLIAGSPSWMGTIERNVFATNMDVLLDLGESSYVQGGAYAGALVYIRIYAQSSVQKTYRAGFSWNPATNATVSLYNQGFIAAPGGNACLLRAGGVAATTWGVEMACVPAGGSPLTLSGVFLGAITHGVEL